ncbi:MAG: N-acetylmuramoyl-L-alanine amidase [Frankia sp.]|nr:N-acetylmuramoyl-L-alanine amidase [Frankia sp.]
MRRSFASLTVVLSVPFAIALPVVSRPAATAHPVRARVREVAIGGIDRQAARGLLRYDGSAGPVRTTPVALSAPASVPAFSVIGVTWRRDSTRGEVDAAVRVRRDGAWSAWQTLDAEPDEGPDSGSPDLASSGVRDGTAPVWVGRADGVQVKVGAAGAAPRDVRVALVDPRTSPADAHVGAPNVLSSAASAAAAVGRPAFVTRAQWGANESIRRGKPSYSPTVKIGFVHHTDTSNSYSAAQAASMIRGIYAFHVKSRGWSDIGYNFLVDRYGRVYEGRYGGVDKAVIGAHTGGFNSNSFGVSLLGTFTTSTPPAGMLTALERVLAWKLAISYRDPTSFDYLTSAGGGTSKYSAGTRVRFATISGHRDAGSTTCPGQQVYSRLPTVRSATRALVGAGLVDPIVTNPTPTYLSGTPVTVTTGVLQEQSWTLTVIDKTTGSAVRRMAGLAAPGTPISASWDGATDLGAPAPPGRYVLQLDSTATDGSTAVPFRAEVEVRSPLPSGVTVQDRSGIVRLLRGGRRQTPTPALLAALRPGDVPLDAYPTQLAAFAVPITPLPDGAVLRSTTGVTYRAGRVRERPCRAAGRRRHRHGGAPPVRRAAAVRGGRLLLRRRRHLGARRRPHARPRRAARGAARCERPRGAPRSGHGCAVRCGGPGE